MPYHKGSPHPQQFLDNAQRKQSTTNNPKTRATLIQALERSIPDPSKQALTEDDFINLLMIEQLKQGNG